MSPSFEPPRVRAAYDAVATAYDAAFGDELDHLPLDAALVDRLGIHAGPAPILELGAGVAPIARRLRASDVVACDLSRRMLAHAPTAAARVQADARRLPFGPSTFGAAAARYVLQHLERPALPGVVQELRRVLRPDALVLVAVHLGEGEIQLDELLGRRFDPIGGAFHSRAEVCGLLAEGGFEVVEEHERGPVGAEGDSRRLYVLAARR